MDDASYKQVLEARFSNNLGSTYLDVFTVTSVLIPSSLLAGLVGQAASSWSPSSWLLRYFLEGLVLLLPMLATCTMSTEFESFVISISFTLITLLVMGLVNGRASGANSGRHNAGSRQNSPKPSTPTASERRAQDEVVLASSNYHALYFSRYRASLMLLTILSILAVDFKIFPTRFIKTELFGVSLMDSGVGCFVFSAAVAFGGKLARAGSNGARPNSESLLSVGSSLPMIILGFIRMAMVWGVDYHEVITEYGKHWNFFFTLAVLPVLFVVSQKMSQTLVSILGDQIPLLHTLERVPAYQGMLWIVLYQFALSSCGLTDFIDSPYRGNLLAANKEGFFSSFGYVSIYYAGIQYGIILLKPPKDGKNADPVKQGVRVMTISAALWILVAISDNFVQLCSRRLCNSTYVFFIVALSSSFLGVFQCLDHLTPAMGNNRAFPESRGGKGNVGGAAAGGGGGESLLGHINRNQLFLFLVGNVLTGIINVSMRTLNATTLQSYLVLFCYMSVVCCLSLFLPSKAEVVVVKALGRLVGF